MDRDLATKLVDTMGDIKTALETIATNTTPAAADAKAPAEETRETVTEEPEEAPATTRKGGK